jgi:hypothetical protein
MQAKKRCSLQTSLSEKPEKTPLVKIAKSGEPTQWGLLVFRGLLSLLYPKEKNLLLLPIR